MARRRLHGETQKRRKKRDTRLLKQHGSVVRPSQTMRPEAFEQKGDLSREDLEFQEAMAELQVERAPWAGEVPERRQAVETVRFQTELGDGDLFQRTMESMGVTPLDQKNPASKSQTKTVSPKSEAVSAPRQDEPIGEPAPSAGSEPVGGSAREDQRQEYPSVSGVPELPEEEDPAALMEALMREGAFDPADKFDGAVDDPDERRRKAAQGRLNRQSDRAVRADLEPDSELDLHGKTQEEAIRAVQNYIMVSHRQRLRHVLIITGKGYNSGESGPVLRDAVYHWLERNGKQMVRAFEWAPPRHGGSGALWVTLR